MTSKQQWETPPRTWRRPLACIASRMLFRNTSTDVEKTFAIRSRASRFWKHLHGRGEDAGLSGYSPSFMETPPRTWRRHINPFWGLREMRNTSTDVEKTALSHLGFSSGQKHLHGRGEDASDGAMLAERLETPPRTWRRPCRVWSYIPSLGNTSTDVEKTIQIVCDL